MPEWRSITLKEAIKIKHGFAFKGQYISNVTPGPTLVTPGNFSVGGGFRCDKRKYYTGTIPREYILSPGDLLVTMTDLSKAGDTLGYSAMVPADATYLHNQRIGLIQIENPSILDKNFLNYMLRTPSYRNYILATSSGSTVRHTSPSRICEYSTRVPELRTQKLIANILGALDDKIAVNDRIARTSRELGQAMFAGSLKSSTLQLIELAEVTVAITRGITPKYSDDDDAVVVLNQKCVRDGRVILDPARKTLAERIREPKLLRRDDVLVNSTGVGTLGRVARWTFDMQASTDSHVTIVRFDPAKVDPVCGGFALLAAQPDIEALGEGSTGQTELSRKRLGDYQIALPSPEVMQQLRPNLESLEVGGEAAMEQSKTLAELRDALLPRLMSGQIRIKDAEKVVEDAV